VPLTPKEVEHI
jgi:hypothetical protein